MHQLLLLRHAKASRDEPDLPDRERPLTARGLRDAAVMRDAMRRLGLIPDLVLVSPARRTLQTLDALEPWDETPLIEPVERLYLGTWSETLATIRMVAETVRGVLVIGHNPGLQELATKLVGPAPDAAAGAKFPTAALAELAIPGSWRQLGTGHARLVRFLTPADLTGPISPE